MARRQFLDVAELLEIPQSDHDRLLYPKRSIAVSCPIRLDDGRTRVFQGYRVQHHLTLGPTKGGTRFAPNINIGEVSALAIWMSWKCALAGLPYGGAKGGVAVNVEELSVRELESLSRRYIQEMIPFIGPHKDVMAPDIGTNEQTMAWFMDTYSMHMGETVGEIVTGKPVATGGTAGRREATGHGVSYLIMQALGLKGMKGEDCTAIVQGFGNVGSVTAKKLSERGVRITGVSDASAAYHDPAGLDVAELLAYVGRKGKLAGFSEQSKIDPDELILNECDILVPAAVEQVIHEGNASLIRCRVLAEAANGPTTPEADIVLKERGDIFVIPDILCNSGGVIVSYFEWVQSLQRIFWDQETVQRQLEQLLDRSMRAVLDMAQRRGITNREAALAIGVRRVWEAKNIRGLFP